MPLDRRIKLRLQAEGAYVQGRYVEGAITALRLWAERKNVDVDDVEASEGIRDRRQVQWTIRHRRDVAVHPITRMSLVDDRGVIGNIENVAESDARRRFITLTVLMTDDLEPGS